MVALPLCQRCTALSSPYVDCPSGARTAHRHGVVGVEDGVGGERGQGGSAATAIGRALNTKLASLTVLSGQLRLTVLWTPAILVAESTGAPKIDHFGCCGTADTRVVANLTVRVIAPALNDRAAERDGSFAASAAVGFDHGAGMFEAGRDFHHLAGARAECATIIEGRLNGEGGVRNRG
jgi:hypothetical protein